MGIILEASHLTYGYDESSHAIEDLSIAFEEGKTTAILGANGAGKSTLFLHLNGILQPEQGEVRFRGQPISYKKAGLRQLRSKVGIVFQNPDDQLFSASVYQDISFGAVNMGLPAEEVHRRVETVMEQVGITYLKDRPTHALDEPTAGLDPVGISELMHLLQDVCRQQHTTIILSTHDIDVVPIYADVIDVMDKGHMVAHGTPAEIFAQPELLREHHLRLPRISHLLEILHKEDHWDVDASISTISGARKELLRHAAE